ncbi:hypothetical protein CCACVL1_14085, partial [Corchorus capsularis]
VRLLNVTLKGNDYLVRWGIFPAASANYLSNTTALSIILRLRDHRMQLPERFGNYKLVEWNAEPQRKLSWWQNHYLSVVLGFLITLVLGLSATGIWLVHRHRRQSVGAYEPVGNGPRGDSIGPTHRTKWAVTFSYVVPTLHVKINAP